MITLAIDTSSPNSSLAVFDEQNVIVSVKHQSNKLQTGFFKVIEDVFKNLKYRPEEIERIIIGIGPGSFTGVRVGVSLAKTYCQLTSAELIPIPSYFLSFNAFQKGIYYLPATPSTRTECYAAIFRIIEDNQIEIVHEIDDGGPARIKYWINHLEKGIPIHIYGEASRMFNKMEISLEREIIIHDSKDTMPDASNAFHLIKSFPTMWKAQDPLKTKPLYVRPSPAELQRIGGQRNKK